MSFSLSLTIKNILKDIFKLKNDKIDASRIEGTIPIESLPPASLERVKVVQNDAARLALTKATVQNGDTVKVKDTKKMYFVVDDTKLDQETGYEEYVSGGAASAEIAEKAKLALNSEKLDGLTLDALRTEIRGYPANIQNGSIKNQHLAADFSFPGNKLADGSITNNKLVYKSITLDKIADGVLTAANVGAYSKSEVWSKTESDTRYYDKNTVNSKVNEKVSRSGDTMTGPLNFANDTWNKIGDDVFMGDRDRGGRLCIKSSRADRYTGLAFFAPNNEGDATHLYYDHDRKALFFSKWIGTENNVGGIHGYVYNDNSYWKLWGSDTSQPSTAYDIVCNGVNAEKGKIFIRKFVNGTQVVSNEIIASDNNAYFQHAVTANRFYAHNWFRCYDNCGVHWEKWGGGWYMQDSDWIRTYGNKNIFTAGKMKADAGFEGKASSSGWADGADYSNRAVRVENDYRNMRFHWSGQGGQPTWLWGGNDGENMYVWNPSNFTVSRANTAGRADSAATADFATKIRGNKLIFENGTELWIE